MCTYVCVCVCVFASIGLPPVQFGFPPIDSMLLCYAPVFHLYLGHTNSMEIFLAMRAISWYVRISTIVRSLSLVIEYAGERRDN